MTGRTLPHSTEAEERLIATLLTEDANAVMLRCVDAHITKDSFYDSKLATMFEAAAAIWSRNEPLSADVLALELQKTNKLEAAGGIPHVAQVSGLVPTSAEAAVFIRTVRDHDTLRKLIRSATEAVESCYTYSGDVDLLYAEITNRIADAGKQYTKVKGKPATQFEDVRDDDPAILIGDRYICRGSVNIICSTSGMGKSSLSLQAAVLWALGKPLFDIKPTRPLKSLIFQSEDDDADIGAVIQSIKYKLNPTEEQLALIEKNVIIYSERAKRGAEFLQWMKGVCEREQPDLVWINPLHAYFDGDIKDASEVGRFVREGLAKANPDTRWAYIAIHHTPKPQSPAEKKKERQWNEEMYEMAGSAELINAARAVIILKPTATEGSFTMVLAKRGKQAGVKQQTDDGQWEVTTRIPIGHCPERRETKYGKEVPVIWWELRTPDAPAAAPEKKGRKREFLATPLDVGMFLQSFPASDEECQSFSACLATAKSLGFDKSQFNRCRTTMHGEGYIVNPNPALWKRTEKGDNAVNRYLKSQNEKRILVG